MTDRPDYECRNCETRFEGSFCPNCGQSTTEYDRPFLFLLSDFASGIFSFDARLWKSFSVLLLRPGGMEADYTDGRRARYVPPFRLYLFVSFFFFLLLTTITDRMLEENRSYISSLAIEQKEGEPVIALIGEQAAPQTENIRRVGEEVPVDTVGNNFNVSIDSTNEQKVRDILSNPEKYMGRFFRYFSWSLFILMPLYGSLLWLFFRNSRRFYLPHFLLSMNQHLIAFVILTALLLPQWLWPHRDMGWEGYLNFSVPLYHIIGAKRLYGRGWVSTVFRLLGAQVLYFVVILLAVAVVAYFALV